MKNLLKSPLFRISLALAMLTVSMLLISDFLGLAPDSRSAEMESRKVIAESLAIQFSSQLGSEDHSGIQHSLGEIVKRNDQIVSAAIRQASGKLLIEFGDHKSNWFLKVSDKSTPDQIKVPLFNKQGNWGNIELKFKQKGTGDLLLGKQGSFVRVVLFTGFLGFIAYWIFLKRAMRELNPDDVIPDRVRTALDTFSEGLMVLDNKGRVVFSNSALLKRLDIDSNKLIGKNTGEMGWEFESMHEGGDEMPWDIVLKKASSTSSDKVRITTSFGEVLTFNIKAVAISSSSDSIQGVMVTLDDISEIENKHQELNRMYSKLEESKHEITKQNQELQILATRDPLTGVLNRRSFFQGFEVLFDEAVTDNESLCCIMLDIDHFKLVNDTYGHAVGDQVITWLADKLTENSRSNDLVARYGGEEFCMILPGVTHKIACQIAERIRQAVESGIDKSYPQELEITSSFGVASILSGASSHNELIEQADWALYAAKKGGRNQVISWSKELVESGQFSENDSASNVVVHLKKDSPTKDVAKSSTVLPEGQPDNLFDFYMNQPGRESDKLPENPVLPAATSKDPVVYLPNRMLLFDRIDQAIKSAQRSQGNVAVLVLNFETIQRVSDTMGISVGEKLKKISVNRLKNILRDTDTVAMSDRLELSFSISLMDGHQIVIVLTDLQETEFVTSILQRIFSVHEKPVQVESNDYYLDANIGVSLYPFDGQEAEILLRNASSAMREVRESNESNSFRFYADEINQRFQQRIQLEAELHRTMENDDLELYFQPKVNLKNGEIQGMEALLRWDHPQMGFISPADFIPLAEQTGLINEIGLWVIRNACQQITHWKESGLGIVTVAVNLSPVQFRNPDLASDIIKIVNEFNMPINALEIEITEGVIMQDIDAAVAILQKLHNAGLSVALDDFGTGYSSLSYLKRFPLSKIKIDRSFISDFVNDANEAAIVSAIIAMGHSLGLKVVAEGVETAQQLQFLQDLQCDEMQGFLVSKPLPKEAARELLAHPGKVRRLIVGFDKPGKQSSTSIGMSPTPGMIGLLNNCPTSPTRQ